MEYISTAKKLRKCLSNFAVEVSKYERRLSNEELLHMSSQNSPSRYGMQSVPAHNHNKLYTTNCERVFANSYLQFVTD